MGCWPALHTSMTSTCRPLTCPLATASPRSQSRGCTTTESFWFSSVACFLTSPGIHLRAETALRHNGTADKQVSCEMRVSMSSFVIRRTITWVSNKCVRRTRRGQDRLVDRQFYARDRIELGTSSFCMLLHIVTHATTVTRFDLTTDELLSWSTMHIADS